MAITDWSPEERPREKLLMRGAHALSDAELLAIFLRVGVKGKTAVDLARELLRGFGSLRQLFDADAQKFCATHGMGEAKYVQLQAVLEMSRRYLGESLNRGDALLDSNAVRLYLLAKLRDCPYELFACLFLDSRNRLIHYEELFRGTLHASEVYPREIVRRALYHNAASVIFAHNHPSGDATPSQADIHLTHHLIQALALVDIQVLDHFVVGDAITSFVETGLMRPSSGTT